MNKEKNTKYLRIHIFGASGSGTSALGKALSKKLGIPVFDFDNYFWEKTNPPFTVPRQKNEKFRMIEEDLQGLENFIISGHYAMSYEPLDSRLTHAIFLYVPAKIRQKRINERDWELFGARILEGSDMYDAHEEFIEWAGHYDLNDRTGRNLAHHLQRMELLQCPVIKIEGDIPLEASLKNVINALADINTS